MSEYSIIKPLGVLHSGSTNSVEVGATFINFSVLLSV